MLHPKKKHKKNKNRDTANRATVEIKYNHKKIFQWLKERVGKRRKKETKTVHDKLKTESKIVDLNTSVSIITLDVNGLKTETWNNFKEFSSPHHGLSLGLV